MTHIYSDCVATHSVQEQRAWRTGMPMYALLKANNTYPDHHSQSFYFLSHSSWELNRNKLQSSSSHWNGPKSQSAPPKIKKAAETKVETQINFQEFCFVFRVFGSKRRNPQTVTPFVCNTNTIPVVQSHL